MKNGSKEEGHEAVGASGELCEIPEVASAVPEPVAKAAKKASMIEDAVKGGVAEGVGALVDEVGEKLGDSTAAKVATKVIKSVATAAAKGLAGSVLGGIMGKPLDPVAYDVRIKGGPDLDWQVRRFHLVEGISEPYEMALDLMSEQTEAVADVDDLLGADLVLEYGRNEFSRQVCGVIDQVDLVGVESDKLTVRLRVVPALRALAQRVDTRLFQDLDVPHILQEVLEPALGEYGRKLDVTNLNEGYLVRDYCVQYGESDLGFVHRLMQEEGISYYFEPDEDAGVEIMVLADQNADEPNSDFPEVEGVLEGAIEIIADRAEQADVESLRYLDWQRSEQVNKLSTRRYNWKRADPEAMPEAEQEHGEGTRGRVREIYSPDDRRRIEDRKDDDGYEGTDVTEDEDKLAEKRFQMLRMAEVRGQGASNVTGMRAGGRFKIGAHPHPEVEDKELLVTRVVHFGDCPDRELQGSSGGERYQNSFECLLAAAVYRPPVTTARYRIYGAQTATVVGPSGEEIHTDKHGRIKVRFHWDRKSPADDTASCWVRVAQMWGGQGWGTWFLPRIGMEVVVQFLDGNPDRPLVVGCVYNSANQPPLELPGQKTRTTIKSNSSKGGGGFNELRFEDLKGEEEIFVHAQKDLTEAVRNNRSRSVGSNESVTIDGNQTLVIKGAPANGETPGAPGQVVIIDGEHSMAVTQQVLVDAGTAIRLTVSETMIHISKDRIELKTDGGATLILEGANIHLNP
jgi:type VI secretion system secreted protein VgrG